jgi:hypothetical protein
VKLVRGPGRAPVCAALLLLALFPCAGGRADPGGGAPPVTVPPVTMPPPSFFEKVRERDREAARRFYAKHVDIEGIPAAASEEVADEALRRTHEIVSRLLAGRPDLRRAMVERGTYLVVIGKDQVYTDMPEYRNSPNKEYLNERVRGTGGNPTSFGEENLLSLPLDRYDDESIAVHELRGERADGAGGAGATRA